MRIGEKLSLLPQDQSSFRQAKPELKYHSSHVDFRILAMMCAEKDEKRKLQ